MDKPDVKVIICGSVGTGKSTIAQLIMDTLSKNGIAASYTNPDNLSCDTQGMLFKKASESLRNKVVLIDEQQTHRDSSYRS